jgi:epoxyqueuosine reductase QueG
MHFHMHLDLCVLLLINIMKQKALLYKYSSLNILAVGVADYNEVKSSLEEHMQKLAADSFLCLICNYQARQSHHITNHIEAKHMHSGHTYQCDQCEQVCPTKNALNAHKSRKHRKKAQF